MTNNTYMKFISNRIICTTVLPAALATHDQIYGNLVVQKDSLLTIHQLVAIYDMTT